MRAFKCAFIGFAALMACAGAAGAVDLRALPASEGAAIIGSRDEYTREYSPADIGIRLRRARGGNVDDVMALYRASTLDWTAGELARLEAMRARVQARTDALAAWLPDEVGFIKTNDRVEGGLPHTRGTAIVFGDDLPEDDATLDELYFHELFHVISRRNMQRRDEFYALVGFQRCTRLNLPRELWRARITNPDAPVDAYAAPFAERWVMPRLMSNSATYEAGKDGFTAYFDLRFLVMTRDARGVCRVVREDGEALVLSVEDGAAAVLAASGGNTGYVLHPEELVADNFAQLMTGQRDVASPAVHERLRVFLGVPVDVLRPAEADTDAYPVPYPVEP